MISREGTIKIGHTGDVKEGKIKFGLDTGSTRSILSLNTLKRLGLTMKHSDVKILTADNNVKPVLGLVEDVEI